MSIFTKLLPENSKNQGQSIIEVLIVILVVGTVLTALAAGLTMSIKNTTQSKQRSLATSFAQESLEVFHRERSVSGWSSFHGALNSGTYCFNQLPVDSTEFELLSPGACPVGDHIAGTNFKREATVTVGPDEVTVVSTVSWFDGDTEKQVSVQQGYREIH